MNAAQIVGDVIHDLLGMNVVVAQQVDVVVLSLQGPVLSPGISRAVQLQLPHLKNVKKNYNFFTNRNYMYRYALDEGTIKTPDPKCRLYWCLIQFTDWRYSQSCWYSTPL